MFAGEPIGCGTACEPCQAGEPARCDHAAVACACGLWRLRGARCVSARCVTNAAARESEGDDAAE